MEMPSYFIDFLAAIRPTEQQTKCMSEAHTELQELLRQDDQLKPVLVTTFVQGSYRRHTALKACRDNRCDVDVVAVTRFDRRKTSPQEALDAFRPFLEKHHKGRYKPQGRSWGIEVSKEVKLDLVPTAAPSESMLRLFEGRDVGAWFEHVSELLMEERKVKLDPIVEAVHALRAKDPKWPLEPLDIPDREAKRWDQTHPIAQIEWTVQKNEKTNGHYVNIVKAVKWWRREHEPIPKYPKSYPLEHLLGVNCPDGVRGVGAGIVLTLENAVRRYAADVASGRTPYLHDHGFSPADRTHDVMRRISPPDFAAFYKKSERAAGVAREALECSSMHESSKLWRQLFGDEFPEAPPDQGGGGGKGGFTPRTGPSVVTTSRFA
jgi:hypothetical protein